MVFRRSGTVYNTVYNVGYYITVFQAIRVRRNWRILIFWRWKIAQDDAVELHDVSYMKSRRENETDKTTSEMMRGVSSESETVYVTNDSYTTSGRSRCSRLQRTRHAEG